MAWYVDGEGFFFWKPLATLFILDTKNKKYPLVFFTAP